MKHKWYNKNCNNFKHQFFYITTRCWILTVITTVKLEMLYCLFSFARKWLECLYPSYRRHIKKYMCVMKLLIRPHLHIISVIEFCLHSLQRFLTMFSSFSFSQTLVFYEHLLLIKFLLSVCVCSHYHWRWQHYHTS